MGIGGIGMSALARHLQESGHVVAGYDLTPSPLLDALQDEGITVTHSTEVDDLPKWARLADQENVSVIWTPALPLDHPLLMHFQQCGIRPMKRAELLGQLTRHHPTLAVAGTHGKTTTTNWLAAMMLTSTEGCHAFLGGLMADSGTNHLTSPNANWHVVEADEYDRSFHHLHPSVAAITNLEPDHLDVYGDAVEFRKAFERFGRQVKDTLILPIQLPWSEETMHPDARLERFAVLEPHDSIPDEATHVAIQNSDRQSFHFKLGRERMNHEWEMEFSAIPSLAGKHNVANALVAAALASHAGIEQGGIKKVIEQFSGVKRRMEIHLDTELGVYIDDYAHHPTELEVLLEGVRTTWPDRHITLVFQPHLFTRTRDFLSEFAHVLSKVDRLFLLPIYPAREAPIEGVDAQLLFDNISGTPKHLSTSDSIFGDLKACPVDVLITAGAGDIDRLVPQAIQHMKERQK